MILALFVSGCKSTRETTISSVTDLLAWDRKVTATLATIPSSLATLRVPIDSLRRLPEGATYTQKEGQATASVGLEGKRSSSTPDATAYKRWSSPWRRD